MYHAFVPNIHLAADIENGSNFQALEKWGNWGQIAPGVSNGQSEIKFTKLEFARPEPVAAQFDPDEGFTGLVSPPAHQLQAPQGARRITEHCLFQYLITLFVSLYSAVGSTGTLSVSGERPMMMQALAGTFKDDNFLSPYPIVARA